MVAGEQVSEIGIAMKHLPAAGGDSSSLTITKSLFLEKC